MRFGFTTGSCAAAASKAAAFMLLTGKEKKEIKITTPKGIIFSAQILDIKIGEREASCAVLKDGGDDPDVTTGAHIVSTARIASFSPAAVKNGGADGTGASKDEAKIIIKGGKGVGKVTKPGLDQKVGSAAINHVPRQMIEKEVLEVCRVSGFSGTLEIEISVPEGGELSKKTFNPRLGITGGISILGTSGIVEPMSSQALKDTILVELRQQKALGQKIAVVAPGNYGLDFVKREFKFNLDKAVKCSNFIGDTLDMAAETGFKKLLLIGHIGKLVKLSGGIMNTHSREGDCRMELLAAAAVKSGCTLRTAREILSSLSTEEALEAIKRGEKQAGEGARENSGAVEIKDTSGSENSGTQAGVFEKTMDYLIKRIMFFLEKRAAGRLKTECIVFCNEYGLLSKSEGALEMLEEAKL